MTMSVTLPSDGVDARREASKRKPAATKKRVALAAKSRKTSPGSGDLTKSPMPGMVPGQTLCAHYKKGVCKYGDRCRFLHTPCRDGDECKNREKGCPFGHARLKRRVTVPEDIKSLIANALTAAEEGDVECSLLRKISSSLHDLILESRERDLVHAEASRSAKEPSASKGKPRPASKAPKSCKSVSQADAFDALLRATVGDGQGMSEAQRTNIADINDFFGRYASILESFSDWTKQSKF